MTLPRPFQDSIHLRHECTPWRGPPRPRSRASHRAERAPPPADGPSPVSRRSRARGRGGTIAERLRRRRVAMRRRVVVSCRFTSSHPSRPRLMRRRIGRDRKDRARGSPASDERAPFRPRAPSLAHAPHGASCALPLSVARARRCRRSVCPRR